VKSILALPLVLLLLFATACNREKPTSEVEEPVIRDYSQTT
jgi:hypothetical protein